MAPQDGTQDSGLSTQHSALSTDLAEAVLRADLTPAAPRRVVLCPWGEVRVNEHVFVLDEESAAAVCAKHAERRTDALIDYEHHSEGGEYAAPDGLVRAAGWIKSLRAEPGVGLVADVEWTARARSLIAAREYRYISPVIPYNTKTRRPVRLKSAALTNQPAIDRLPALVAGRQAGCLHHAGGQGRRKDAPMEKLKQLLGLGADATDDAVAEAVATLKETAEASAAIATAVAKEVGAEKFDSAEAASKAVQTAIAKASKEAEGMVPAEIVKTLTAEIQALKAGRENDEFAALIAKHREQVAPAEEERFRKLFAADPALCAQVVASLPRKVGAAAETGGGPRDRDAVIATARAKFASEHAGQAALCSERAAINSALREARHRELSNEEVASKAIGTETE